MIRTFEIIITLIDRFMFCYCYVKHRWRKMNDSEKTTNENEMSDKGNKLRSYPVKMKVEAVKYADNNGNRTEIMLLIKREFGTPCPIVPVECAPFASALHNFTRSASPAN